MTAALSLADQANNNGRIRLVSGNPRTVPRTSINGIPSVETRYVEDGDLPNTRHNRIVPVTLPGISFLVGIPGSEMISLVRFQAENEVAIFHIPRFNTWYMPGRVTGTIRL
jgi:hypothetical protein